jgi:sterol desaturase/sphingolipid hydroxylase (fatty acid hydroxylase superfamily)
LLLALEYPEPTVYAIPFYLVTLLGEAWLLSRRPPPEAAPDAPQLAGYELRDTAGSISLGLGSLVFVTLINLAIYKLAGLLFAHRICDVGRGATGYLVALVGWDLLYYWHHRAEHRVRLLWACHVSHHSSKHFNLSTALRQPWTPVAGLLFYPWLALLGVQPTMIMIAAGLNLIYQYWIHTEVIRRLPRFVEAVLNTPSHHRVHHGSNAQYLDKNYGGILILWDRLFGTFEPEETPVTYGLTKNISSHNPFYIAFHEYGAALRDAWRARGLRDKLSYLLRPPGWQSSR